MYLVWLLGNSWVYAVRQILVLPKKKPLVRNGISQNYYILRFNSVAYKMDSNLWFKYFSAELLSVSLAIVAKWID